jgi:hypothetical protein
MARWNLVVDDATDRAVRVLLGKKGFKKGDLSEFVEKAVRGEVLRQTVREVREENADLSDDEAMKLAEEAVAWARANPS